MERTIDNLLENIFGGLSLQMYYANIIVGALLIVAGIVLLKKQTSKGPKIAGWICVAIGCLGVISGIVQLVN